jgi:hypothetical protein
MVEKSHDTKDFYYIHSIPMDASRILVEQSNNHTANLLRLLKISRHRIVIKNPDSLPGLLVECLGFVHEQSPVSLVLSLVELCERYHTFLHNGSSAANSEDRHLLAYICSIMTISTPVFDGNDKFNVVWVYCQKKIKLLLQLFVVSLYLED